MKTPICDFLEKYAKSNTLRLHMPGHKGCGETGSEKYDITEVFGADSLYEASGIIAQSEDIASKIFNCKTYYSTEGSSLCIRAIMYLVTLYAKQNNTPTRILAGRNAHKTFISAASLLDFDIEWIYPDDNSSYLSVFICPDKLDRILTESTEKFTAVYITSPDYLGNISDIKKIANVCHKHDTLLICDNAHGAYLHFLENSQHPIALGADICCDSAHKTLPVLTGGAYMHIADTAPQIFIENAKNALSLFGSTSPSYLILRSLDRANSYIENGYKDRLSNIVSHLSKIKEKLLNSGYTLNGNEPLKITVNTKSYGYLGYEFADILRKHNIECEFSDNDFMVLMFTPEITEKEITYLENVLLSIPQKKVIADTPPANVIPKKIMSPRQATLSMQEKLPAKECLGKILAHTSVGCPPAVPIIVSGELIDENVIKCLKYYQINECWVVKE